MAGNTYSSDLLTEKLEESATTILSETLAPLGALTKGFSTDVFKPKASVELKFVTSGSTTLTDPVSFESGDSDVSAVKVEVHQYSQAFHVTNDELNSGMRLADITAKNARTFGESLWDLVAAKLTTANFTGEALVRAPAAFGFSDLSAAWGLLKKSSIKNAVLDGDFLARIINQPTFYQRTGTGPGGGFKAFGWDEIDCCSRWSAAGEHVRGIFLNPQALGCVAGLPLQGNNVTLQSKVITLEGLDLSVALNTWFSLATRTLWASYDLMFGVSVLDATAGYLLKDS